MISLPTAAAASGTYKLMIFVGAFLALKAYMMASAVVVVVVVLGAVMVVAAVVVLVEMVGLIKRIKNEKRTTLYVATLKRHLKFTITEWNV